MYYTKEYEDLGFSINEKGYADVLHTDLNNLIQGYDDDIQERERQLQLDKWHIESLKEKQIDHHTKILKAAKDLCDKGIKRCKKNDFEYAEYFKGRYEDRLKTIQKYAEKYGIDLSDKKPKKEKKKSVLYQKENNATD
jgi:hypothetical protein